MSAPVKKIARAFAVILLAMGVSQMPAAHADDDEHEGFFSKKDSRKYGGENRGRSLQSVQPNAKYLKECSDCHIAYAPGLMSAESWRRIMAGLDKHFGTDASLYAQDNKEITDYLIYNASNRWTAAAAPLRITEAAWFKRKHDGHEVKPEVWKNPKVKSPANCAACHPEAESGDFNEHRIRMPS